MEIEHLPIAGDTDGRQFNELASLFDAPAYVRRGRAVEQELQFVVARCEQQRQEWLMMPRLQLGRLQALAGEWSGLSRHLADAEQVTVLESLWAMLQPKLRVPLEPTTSARKLRRALAELIESLERFNARWQGYLGKVDVRRVNELREDYNRYYVLEKACALRSDRLARLGYSPTTPLDLAELQRHLPLLPVPRVAS